MDPAKLAQDLLQKNFPKFGSFRKFCEYRSMADTYYDAANGYTQTNEQATVKLWIIFDDPTPSTLIPENAVPHVVRLAIFPRADLPFIPQLNDEIVREDGSVWRVIAITEDPGPAHYELVVQPYADMP